MTTLTLSKRGSLTLPPAIRRRLGLDRVDHPLLIVEERNGGVFLHPAAATPLRDISGDTVKGWIKDDESAMAALRGTPRSRGKRA